MSENSNSLFSKQLKQGRILVAEDNYNNMKIISQQLVQIEKLELCDFVHDGQELVDKFTQLIKQDTLVSYVLTDFAMPNLNGMQAVKLIQNFLKNHNNARKGKGLPIIPDPKIVFLTAFKSENFDKLLLELNVAQVYSKPLTMEELAEILEI